MLLQKLNNNAVYCSFKKETNLLILSLSPLFKSKPLFCQCLFLSFLSKILTQLKKRVSHTLSFFLSLSLTHTHTHTELTCPRLWTGCLAWLHSFLLPSLFFPNFFFNFSFFLWKKHNGHHLTGRKTACFDLQNNAGLVGCFSLIN